MRSSVVFLVVLALGGPLIQAYQTDQTARSVPNKKISEHVHLPDMQLLRGAREKGLVSFK
jgi:hypothetical protein